MIYDIKNEVVMQFKVDFDPSCYLLDKDQYTITVGSTFFSKDRGYEPIDAGKVVMLDINESVMLDNDGQKVTRIK